MYEGEIHPRVKDPDAWGRHCARAKRCKSCGARIIWLKTAKQKWIPIDFNSVHYLDTKYKPKDHIAHFATCPYAGKHRKGTGETSSSRR